MSKTVKIATDLDSFMIARRIITEEYILAEHNRKEYGIEIPLELERLKAIYDTTFYSLEDDEAKEGLQV